MKNKQTPQIIIIALIALVAGFFAGYSLKNYPPSNDEISGSIGKVSNYRNVQVTEADITLRNSLIADTAQCTAYSNYFKVNYYQLLKRSVQLNNVIEICDNTAKFATTNADLLGKLKAYYNYLEKARVDVLGGINAVVSINPEKDLPIVKELNLAQNAIARSRGSNPLILDMMDAISLFVEQGKDVDYSELEDAHDILLLNLLESSIIAGDKAGLAYLDNKPLMNDAQGLKAAAFHDGMAGQFASVVQEDVARLGSLFNDGGLGVGVNLTDVALQSSHLASFCNEVISNSIRSGAQGIFSVDPGLASEQMQNNPSFGSAVSVLGGAVLFSASTY